MTDLWSWFFSGEKPEHLKGRLTEEGLTLMFTWSSGYRYTAGYSYHSDKQAAFCSHQVFQMFGVLEQKKLYLSRDYFCGMYYEKRSLGNSKSPECLLK